MKKRILSMILIGCMLLISAQSVFAGEADPADLEEVVAESAEEVVTESAIDETIENEPESEETMAEEPTDYEENLGEAFTEEMEEMEAAEEDLSLLQASSDGYTVSLQGRHDYGKAASMMPYINNERQKLGLNALTLDRELTDAAMLRAAEIAVSFSHLRPNKTACTSVCEKAHGENIAYGYDAAEDTYMQWYYSPGHYGNMVDPDYRSIGIGHFEYDGTSYWVQLFGWDPADQKETRTGITTVERIIDVRGKPPVPDVLYETHVQKIGWQDPVKNGEMSGTEGKSLRLEAISIWLSNSIYSGDIEYRAHVQTYGWQGWRINGDMAGTGGESKRLEAVQIRLTGDLAKYYDVWYQTHIQKFGWSGWACNGAQCGSAGYSYRLEGIRIKLVEKGGSAPGSTQNSFYQKEGASASPSAKISGAKVGYNTHVQTYGWQPYVYDGAMAGTQGESKRLEGIHIELIDMPYVGDVVYRTHVQTYGWEPYWLGNGEMSGTSGESKRLEGIQIFLTGSMAEHYDVYYCVHAQTYGWLDWAKNGQMAGTSGLGRRLEGIRIKLVPKGEAAPGPTAKPYVLGANGSLPDNPYENMGI